MNAYLLYAAASVGLIGAGGLLLGLAFDGPGEHRAIWISAAIAFVVQLLTFTIAQNTAVSFTPPSTIGMVQAFATSLSLGDPITALFSYRADGLGHTELLAKGITNPSDVEVRQLTALTGTTGTAGKFTYSAHTDGKIYIENRRSGPPHTVALYLVGVSA